MSFLRKVAMQKIFGDDDEDSLEVFDDNDDDSMEVLEVSLEKCLDKGQEEDISQKVPGVSPIPLGYYYIRLEEDFNVKEVEENGQNHGILQKKDIKMKDVDEESDVKDDIKLEGKWDGKIELKL